MSARIAGLLVALALALFIGWFFTTHEKVTDTRYTGYRGEARYNELLAAQLLLEELDIEAASRATLVATEWLPAVEDTIIAPLSAQLGSANNESALTDWLNSGGHLVVLPPEERTSASDSFLWRLGFRLVDIDSADESEDSNESDPDAAESDDTDSDYLIDLDLTDYAIELRGNVIDYSTLVSNDKAIVVRRRFGDGFVTVVAGPFFENDTLPEFNHSRLLMDIVDGNLTSGKVWLIYDESFESLWQLLRKHAPYVLASAAILLVLWLWSVIPRFGPSVRTMTLNRRSIIEHIDATGAFSWRHRSNDALLAGAVDELLSAAERRAPGIGRQSAAEQSRQLAAMSGRDAQQILDALALPIEHRQPAFLRRIQILQLIRNEL
ncbi:MAG: hypothetical protein AAGC71_12525 [Pseudomonadota bacterium]